MATGERRRERLAWAGYVTYVAVPPALALISARTAWSWPPLVISVVVSVQIAHLLAESGYAVLVHLSRHRVPFLDRLPSEQWASLVALPTSATVGATAGAVAVEWPRANGQWVSAVVIAAVGLLFAFGVPLLAAALAARERGDERVALYDPLGDPERQLLSARWRWDALVAARRRFLARRRVSWLGTLDAPPAHAWPRHPRRFGQPRYVIPATALAPAVLTGIVANVVLTDEEWSIDAFGAPVLAFVAALGLAVHVYRMTAEEQTEAHRLRSRAVELGARLAERPAEEAVRPRPGLVFRVRQALFGRR